MPISERKTELRRRRKRSEKYAILKRKLEKATASERTAIAEKIRRMAPNPEVVLDNFGLTERSA
ncbi:DUF6800 family protein [Thermopirellula anaerolimosa]